MTSSPDGERWRVAVLTQLVYPPTVRTTGTALPVDTGKSVEREIDLQLQGLVRSGRVWQPGLVAENRKLPFTDKDNNRW